MAGPLDLEATLRETIATRALVTALGQALAKKKLISHSDVEAELSNLIQGLEEDLGDAELIAEIKRVARSVVTW